MTATPNPKAPTPATPSQAHERMRPRWDLAEAVLGGTESMRAAGKDLLPQHEQESNSNYQNRLDRATFVNMTEMTIDALVGRPFSKPVVLGDDVPAQIEELCEDVDLQGNNLQQFARSWFREGWAKGLSHVLVDFPVPERQVDGDGNPVPRTLEDDRREGVRPFAVRIRPENVVAAYAEVVGGKEVLVHLRIMETSVERDGWGESIKQRVRVLEPGSWELYRPVAGKKDEWELEDSGQTGLDEIPLVTFYAGKRDGLHECKPPLLDLMHLNITHWQSASDQRNALTVARFPILAGSGVSSTDQVAIGPNRYLSTEAVEGKWYYVEHTGAALEAGREDLQDLLDMMASYGAEFIKAKPGTETATARALDSAEGVSYLQATALDFQDAIERVLQLLGAWLDIDPEATGSAKVHVGFATGEAAASDLEQLLKLRAQRDLSRVGLLNEFQRRGVLSEDFDAEEDKGLLDDEGDEGLGDMFGKGDGGGPTVEIDPATGMPVATKPPVEDPEELEA